MTKYEIMFIVQPNLEEEALKKVVKSLEKTLTSNNAVITLSKELGQKEFAYEIKKYKSGYYFLYNIEAKNDKAVKEFDRVALINENVIRHLIINLDK
ncbi:MAG: 30S ribosomal protein S6 [Tenericutes bacterium]|jgi:small subunit ribosomal protein S6|nr:30S ribosomal protein S6 [Mycoplasmatota bacterium]CCZ56947.1 30S ribosomal protein S6 [Clostridium sp. CAG:762]